MFIYNDSILNFWCKAFNFQIYQIFMRYKWKKTQILYHSDPLRNRNNDLEQQLEKNSIMWKDLLTPLLTLRKRLLTPKSKITNRKGNKKLSRLITKLETVDKVVFIGAATTSVNFVGYRWWFDSGTNIHGNSICFIIR